MIWSEQLWSHHLCCGVLYASIYPTYPLQTLSCTLQIVTRHPAARYCLVPLYMLSWVLLLSGLLATQHWVWVAAFVASLCVTLVPAWLLEFR